MTVKLYKYEGLPQVINKALTLSTSEVTGQFTGPYNMMTPTLRLTGYLETNLNREWSNYLSIDDKKYFIVNWVSVSNNVVDVQLRLDVLETYKKEIGDMQVMLERSSVKYKEKEKPNPSGFPLVKPVDDTQYLTDNMYPTANAEDVEDVYFNFEFDDQEAGGTYVLITAQQGYSIVGEDDPVI